MVKKKRSFEETVAPEPIAFETTMPECNPRTSLEEIKTYNGVIGYILRNSTSAAIDLKDPTKIIDYAILSSSALDATEELSRLFDIGKAKGIIVEGKEVKMLSLTIGENKISVFLEKSVECEKILRKLQSP